MWEPDQKSPTSQKKKWYNDRFAELIELKKELREARETAIGRVDALSQEQSDVVKEAQERVDVLSQQLADVVKELDELKRNFVEFKKEKK